MKRYKKKITSFILTVRKVILSQCLSLFTFPYVVIVKASKAMLRFSLSIVVLSLFSFSVFSEPTHSVSRKSNQVSEKHYHNGAV